MVVRVSLFLKQEQREDFLCVFREVEDAAALGQGSCAGDCTASRLWS